MSKLVRESLNEYEKPGTKKRKLEDGILALYSSNVPDYKIGELKTRAAEAMQEEYRKMIEPTEIPPDSLIKQSDLDEDDF